jgi:hypothetical protein
MDVYTTVLVTYLQRIVAQWGGGKHVTSMRRALKGQGVMAQLGSEGRSIVVAALGCTCWYPSGMGKNTHRHVRGAGQS